MVEQIIHRAIWRQKGHLRGGSVVGHDVSGVDNSLHLTISGDPREQVGEDAGGAEVQFRCYVVAMVTVTVDLLLWH